MLSVICFDKHLAFIFFFIVLFMMFVLVLLHEKTSSPWASQMHLLFCVLHHVGLRVPLLDSMSKSRQPALAEPPIPFPELYSKRRTRPDTESVDKCNSELLAWKYQWLFPLLSSKLLTRICTGFTLFRFKYLCRTLYRRNCRTEQWCGDYCCFCVSSLSVQSTDRSVIPFLRKCRKDL